MYGAMVRGYYSWLVVCNMNFMFSPRVAMMIQFDFHISKGGRYTTN